MLLLNIEPAWISPYVFACFVTLTEKRLPFEVRALDAASGETRSPEYLASTITGRVPSLVDDGFAVAESTAIVEYLEERFPDPPVFPRDPQARARCRQLMSWLRSDETIPIRTERPTVTMFHERARKPLSPEADVAVKKLEEVAQRLIQPGQPHLFGQWSIADADLAFMLHRLILNGDAVHAAVRAWAEAAWQRPSIRAFVDRERAPEKQKGGEA